MSSGGDTGPTNHHEVETVLLGSVHSVWGESRQENDQWFVEGGAPCRGKGVERGGGPPRRSTSDLSPGMQLFVARGTNPDRQWGTPETAVHPLIHLLIHLPFIHLVSQSVTKPVSSRTPWEYADELGPCTHP